MSNQPMNPADYPLGDDPEWERRTPDFVQFTKEGMELIGTLGPSDTIQVNGQDTYRHTIETKEGPKSFLGGVQLDSLILGLVVGTKIKLVFLGMKTPANGGRPFKDFDLFVSRLSR